MSNEQNFQPLSPRLGIAGSSYQLELGKVNNFWTIRLVKGPDILASKIYKDVPKPEEIPLGNHLTGWVLSVLAIPNINTYQIQKTIGFLRQKAMRNVEEQKIIKQTAGKEERSSVVLEKIPDNVPIKRLAPVNTNQENIQSSASEGESYTPVNSSGKRKLASIPIGDGFDRQASVGNSVAASLSNQDNSIQNIDAMIDAKIIAIKDTILDSPIIMDLISQIEKLEERIKKLEEK